MRVGIDACNDSRPDNTPFFEQLFDSSVRSGASATEAATTCADAYLDGKPNTRGKHKTTRAERDACFWASGFLRGLPAGAWQTESLVLALARYFGQERFANAALIERVAAIAPTSVHRAVRYSGLVLSQHSPRRAEVDGLAARLPGEFAELARVLDIFDLAHRQRLSAVAMWKAALANVSPLDLLVYASLHAFEHWVPRDPTGVATAWADDGEIQAAWDGVKNLLTWKLSTAPEGSLALTEDHIGRSLKAHLSPFLFPSAAGPEPQQEMRAAFENLLAAQIELDSFVSLSADAFSYDDGIRFVRKGDALEIVEHDPVGRAAWAGDGDKLNRLHGYWLYRALDEFARSEIALQTIGSSENHEANRAAYIQATRSRLRLTEVYGLGDVVTADSGEKADLFRALLSLELMSAFFGIHFLAPFALHFSETGNALQALSRLAIGGLGEGNQNRFPLTWSDRTAKIVNITGWTVSTDHPTGSARLAGAILDLWSSDWTALAARLRRGEPGLEPDLLERPVLKMGQLLVQLPWIVGLQNNSTAAINNLRRLGARRGEAAAETWRVEQRLGGQFESKGFRVVANWCPPIADTGDAGEVDLICARNGVVFVLEVKSTYLRRSQRDAWLHGATTLRKAGLQLRRKAQAVRQALACDSDMTARLGLEHAAGESPIHGWIVDTSIECDHQRFSGFLKVSLEEVLIALRDDRHLLNDPEGLLHQRWAQPGPRTSDMAGGTLYTDGFSAARFVEVIESQAVWDKPDSRT